MNKAILMGRLTKDPELKQTGNGISVCSFTLAVDRRFKNAQGERDADFIPMVCWREKAEFVSRYFSKGSRMVAVGSIQTRSWDDNDGKRQYKTEIVVDEVYFADSKRDSGSSYEERPAARFQKDESFGEGDGFLTADDDASLPFDL